MGRNRPQVEDYPGRHWRRGESGPGREVNAKRLRKGQEEEGRARREGLKVPSLPAGAKPKFVKITSGVHVQVRGPIVMFKRKPAPETGEWWISRLPGLERLDWKTPQDEILRRVEEAEHIAGPFAGLGRAKDYIRPIIKASDGELGS